MEKGLRDSYELPNNVLKAIPEPLVTVRTLAHQHAPFIQDCLEGVLMQKTTFPVEYVIGEDCTTDGTREVVLEYAKKHPDKIRVVTADYNVGGMANGERCRRITRGKYVALCEGDDCWTDPLKLQKQVELLEAHPEYSFCCGGYESVNLIANEKKRVVIDPFQNKDGGYAFTLKETLDAWLTKTLTLVYREEVIASQDMSKYKHMRDVHLIYHLLKQGKGYYFKQVFGIYRIHGTGIFSQRTYPEMITDHYGLYRELFLVNKDDFTRKMYLKMILLVLGCNAKNLFKKNSITNSFTLAYVFLKTMDLRKDLFFVLKGIRKKISPAIVLNQKTP